MLQAEQRSIYEEEHVLFRDTVRKFLLKEHAPHQDRWEEEGIVSREFWLAAGRAGLICPTVSTDYGGPGLDFRYNAVIDEEMAYLASSAGIVLHSDITADYIAHYGSQEQKRQWLP
jgi:alkylation response protein AidB-like acyl-CoA dehydrogenase